MMEHYILDKRGEPVRVSLMEWGAWLENFDNRVLRQQTVSATVSVSTVFLGADHRFFGDGPPILWETMIFGGAHDQYQQRYTSRKLALLGHGRAVAMARRALKQEQRVRRVRPKAKPIAQGRKITL